MILSCVDYTANVEIDAGEEGPTTTVYDDKIKNTIFKDIIEKIDYKWTWYNFHSNYNTNQFSLSQYGAYMDDDLMEDTYYNEDNYNSYLFDRNDYFNYEYAYKIDLTFYMKDTYVLSSKNMRILLINKNTYQKYLSTQFTINSKKQTVYLMFTSHNFPLTNYGDSDDDVEVYIVEDGFTINNWPDHNYDSLSGLTDKYIKINTCLPNSLYNLMTLCSINFNPYGISSLCWPFDVNTESNDTDYFLGKNWHGWRKPNVFSPHHNGVDEWVFDYNIIISKYNMNGNSDLEKNIYSVFDGKVILCKSLAGYGNTVIIQSTENPDFAVLFAHLNSIPISLSLDVVVNTDTTIGTVGNSGDNILFPHLHIAIYKNINTNYNGETLLDRLKKGYSYSVGDNGTEERKLLLKETKNLYAAKVAFNAYTFSIRIPEGRSNMGIDKLFYIPVNKPYPYYNVNSFVTTTTESRSTPPMSIENIKNKMRFEGTQFDE